jgi:Domain of Unknown Function (DUF928)
VTQHHRLKIDTAYSSVLVLALGCFSASLFLATALPLQASESSRLSNSKPAASPYNPPLPPNLGAPKGRTGGGASRGTCIQSQAMHAVLPSDADRSYSLTASERPTFWFYLPNRPHPETRLEFVLQDATDRYVYKTVLTQPKVSAGLVSVTVPEQSSPLVANATYSWTLSLQCNPEKPRQMAFIRGSIQRVAIASSSRAMTHQESASILSTAITTSDQATKARLYAQQGLWYDAITILAQALQTQSADPSTVQVWKDLLERSGLTGLQPPAVATQTANLTQMGSTPAILQGSWAALKESAQRQNSFVDSPEASQSFD